MNGSREFAATQSLLQRTTLLFSVFATASMCFAIGVLAWLMLFDAEPPFTSMSAITTDAKGQAKSVFAVGDTVYVDRLLCAKSNAPVTTGRRLIDVDSGRIYVLATSSGRLNAGCAHVVYALQIPPNVTPGRYRYSAVVQFSNNAFQDGVAELTAPVIEVVP